MVLFDKTTRNGGRFVKVLSTLAADQAGEEAAEQVGKTTPERLKAARDEKSKAL